MHSGLLFSIKPIPHIRGKVADLTGPVNSDLAVLFVIKVKRQILNIVETPIPFIEWLNVHSPQLSLASFTKSGC